MSTKINNDNVSKFIFKPPYDTNLWHGMYIGSNQRHQLKVETSKNYAHLWFSSRESLYEFAMYLLWQAVYTPENERNIVCEREIASYDLNDGKGIRIVDGVRLAADSAELIIYADDKLLD